MIKNRTKPTLYRVRNQALTSHNFKLSAVDLQRLAKIRQAFEEKHGVMVSTSIALSLALEGMAEEIAAGTLRTNREVSEGLFRMKEAAR
ncbi:hypothetical protein [Microvirga mediterraneensis]|uniref:Uncharacterized protein n=1 Tax=Microvirga mediterraneensis TaxID=2754695 RepID=A0A838BUE4_9HYPH|nr:hypothetical protein [Microvirga mediterraneensis]MBA1158679.1 hypothetical protein [Microvirga mediterraneensis]